MNNCYAAEIDLLDGDEVRPVPMVGGGQPFRAGPPSAGQLTRGLPDRSCRVPAIEYGQKIAAAPTLLPPTRERTSAGSGMKTGLMDLRDARRTRKRCPR